MIAIEGKQILKRKLKQFKIKLDDKISGYMMKFFKINASNDLFYNVGTGKIDNKQIKRFVSDYNSSFIGFIRRRIGSNNKKVDKINEIEHSIKFDKQNIKKNKSLLLSLEVKNKVILNKLLKSLKKIDGIDNVSRN